MARSAKAPYYNDDNHLANEDLLIQLGEAMDKLKDEMRTSIPIHSGSPRVGYGVSKAKRGIAADAVISVARAIKALKGW